MTRTTEEVQSDLKANLAAQGELVETLTDLRKQRTKLIREWEAAYMRENPEAFRDI